jgi:adenylylsulfate kinase
MTTPFLIWITGLPASGKSTISKLVVQALREKLHVPVVHLESDKLRSILTPSPNYSVEEREYFYRVLADLGALLNANDINVLIDATANLRMYRNRARSTAANFLEVYIKCPVSVCIERDPKGIYRRAAAGTVTSAPGVQVPYEEPISPEIVIESDKVSPEEAASSILKKLNENP